MADVEQVRAILENGDFGRLLEMEEDDQLDFKGSPYRLENDIQRMELAKDVSAFANACGGIILIGVETRQDPTRQVERAVNVRRFARDYFNKDQMLNVLNEWIYPTVRGLTIEWHASQDEVTEGLVSISVPSDAIKDRPYVVVKVIDEQGKRIGALMGYFERVGSSNLPTRLFELRDRLKDGLRFAEIDSRLQGIEEMIGHAIASRLQPTISSEEAAQRIADARHAAGLDAEPVFWWAAWVEQASAFTDLFQSRAVAAVRLIEEPPRCRAGGFDLRTRREARIIDGRLRRCLIPGSKLLELWQDGLLVFVVPGGNEHMCWAMGSDDSTGPRINNIVLAETAYLFSELATKLSPLAVPPPSSLHLQLGFSNLRFGDKMASLSSSRPSPYFIERDWHVAARDRDTFDISVDLANADAGAIAFRLLAKVYVGFGFEEVDVPYVEAESNPPRVTCNQIV